MNTAAFKALAISHLPPADFVTDPKGIYEYLSDDGWRPYESGDHVGFNRQTFLWSNPTMLEVHIGYSFPLTKPRRKGIGVWCYKYPGRDWEIKPVYRSWLF